MQGLTPFGETAGYNLMLSQRLRNQDQALNNGTVPGGLAYMLNQGVNSYLQAKDAGQRQAADQTYMDALTKPQAPAGGGTDYQQPNAPRVQPGVDAAIGRLSELRGNPYAGRLTQMLAMQKMQQEQEAAASQAKFQQQLYRDQMNNEARIRASAAGRSSVNVNTGDSGPRREFFGLPNLPSGYDYMRDQTGAPVVGQDGAVQLVPIAGGPDARDIAEAEAKAATRADQRENKAFNVLDTVDRAVGQIKDANFPVTGFFSVANAVPGTAAHDLSNTLNTIKANTGFDALQAMRDASPTGGALGAVSEMENRLLQSQIAALEQSQSKEQLLSNLARVRATYNEIIHGSQTPRGDIGNGITAMPDRPGANAGATPKRRRYNPQTGQFEEVR